MQHLQHAGISRGDRSKTSKTDHSPARTSSMLMSEHGEKLPIAPIVAANDATRTVAKRTCSTDMIPAAATRESVRVDLPAADTHARVSGAQVQPTISAALLPSKPTVVDVGNDGHVPDVVLLVLLAASTPKVSL